MQRSFRPVELTAVNVLSDVPARSGRLLYIGRMSSPRPPLIESPADLTAEWLTTALGRGTVADFSVTRIGTGR